MNLEPHPSDWSEPPPPQAPPQLETQLASMFACLMEGPAPAHMAALADQLELAYPAKAPA